MPVVNNTGESVTGVTVTVAGGSPVSYGTIEHGQTVSADTIYSSTQNQFAVLCTQLRSWRQALSELSLLTNMNFV